MSVVRRPLACLALLAFLPAYAQRSELNGTWAPVRYSGAASSPRDETLLRMTARGFTLMRDPPPPVFEFALGDSGGLQLQPDAAEAVRRWRPDTDPPTESACSPASIVMAMNSPFPFEIDLATELIVIKLEYFDLVRIVFLDGRPHPGKDYPHSKTGHSVGHWDGDVLVVDTTHLAPSQITSNGVDHTADVHVIERFRVDRDGATLRWTQEFDDPTVLRVGGVRYAEFRRQAGPIEPYECDPSYAASIRNREK